MNFVTKDITITDAMNDFCRDKVKKLSKFIDTDTLKLTLKKEGQDQLKLELCSDIIRSTILGDVNNSFYSLFEEVTDKFERQIIKYRNSRTYARKAKLDLSKIDDEYTTESDSITKEKVVILSIISPEDAIEEMEALGHSFYAFRDSYSNDENTIVYKKTDGTYGLLHLK